MRCVVATFVGKVRFGEVLCTLGCYVSLLIVVMECSTGIVRACDGVNEKSGDRIGFVVATFVNFSENQRKQLLRTIFDRYGIIHPTTRPHDPCDTRHTNKNL